ncbi:BCCT family transporter [Glutamicibacter protophormiae]|uniref:BCCT family transporter n=1 Tax=Glutamicibacter protophormiae TaxID=37930 RepID=UPI002A8105D3|nr:BCCT family transporter [Glutamicibacter protophormiae]WPR64542.1 BCCT family transporter [Glutamicibacter protophormiae]WPR68036.1 BCCT family transporter [Glutamicibacter protophormiae]
MATDRVPARTENSANPPVELPRFMGRHIPPLDRLLIRVIPPILIVAVIIWVLANPVGASAVISDLRTFVTGKFTWLFILYSVFALAVCIWLASSKVGKIRLGGPKAKPQHSKFAWYSMLFACGQGIGLIFWSVAEPIMLRDENPVIPAGPDGASEGGIIWSYFHWGLTAWAMYCVVAVCLAYSHHNLGKTLTFREATVDILPKWSQRGAGVVVELLAIIATVLGLATSFGFATMQFSSGLTSLLGIEASPMMWMMVIAVFTGITAISAIVGINKGMARISSLNSILSIVLVGAVFVFGPTLYIISTLSQTFGGFMANFVNMSLWTDAGITAQPLDSWQDSWNGWWTVFIWCWVIAFSPFVAGFIARISRGRTIREFVIGVTVIPTLIVMIWIGVIGSAAIYYDDQNNRGISDAVATDTSAGLFAMLDHIPFVGAILLVVSTIVVATYYVTSLDSGIYALSEFVSAPNKSGPVFRVVLVVSIATVATVLLTLGGTAVVDTVQTGTIIGAFPFSFVILLMIVNLIRRLLKRDRAIKQLEKDINNPDPSLLFVPDPSGEGAICKKIPDGTDL